MKLILTFIAIYVLIFLIFLNGFLIIQPYGGYTIVEIFIFFHSVLLETNKK